MNKFAIDFGNSNTVIAFWDEQAEVPSILTLPSVSASGAFLIPSLIHYDENGRVTIGAEVPDPPDSATFRWMKRCLSLRSPYALRIHGEKITAAQAAEDFLSEVIARATAKVPLDTSDPVFSVPTESFEHYSDWLMSISARQGASHIRLIDEAAAAALGCGVSLHPGAALLVFDFGGSTVQSVCVRVMEETRMGHCCRVLGKAGGNLGGSALDRWIYEAVLKRAGLLEGDSRLRPFTSELLRRCETLKQELSEKAFTSLSLAGDGMELSQVWTRDGLEEVFRDNGLQKKIQSVLDEALRSAADHGIREEDIEAVIPVGGSCLIPAVRGLLRERFPNTFIDHPDPMGAVAKGAAVFAGGARVFDTIQHDYAVRYRQKDGRYGFQTIVEKGTPYPSERPVKTMRIKAGYEGQKQMGLPIYELSRSDFHACSAERENEILFEADGSVRIVESDPAQRERELAYWLNEKSPFFLTTESPAKKGTPCFVLTFEIDENKRLLLSAEDIRTGQSVLTRVPIVRLN